MTQPDPATIRRIAEQASRLPADQREQFVRSECAGDEALCSAILAKLEPSAPEFDPEATIDLSSTSDLEATIDIDGGLDAEATVDLDATPDSEETIDPDGCDGKTSDQEAKGLPEQISDFRIIGLLGKGGMGVVYLADQLHPKRRVALKVIRAKLISEDALKRFEVEGHTLAKLSHPGVAQVFSAGIHEEGGASVPFFAMEYVADAEPITDWVDAHDLTERERLEIFADVCDAVAHGHQRGVIHRDLKPQNILVNKGGELKVIDFGVAQVEEEEGKGLERKRQIVGTLQYMPPEQVKGDLDIDTSSDVYALGIVLYQMLVGSTPYDIDLTSVAAATTSIINSPTPSIIEVKPHFGRDLDAIIKKALAKDREERYRTAADFGDDIRRVLADEPVTAREQTATEAIRRFMRKYRTAASAIAAVILVIVLGLVAVSVFAYRTEIARAEEQRQRGIADRALERVEAEKARLEKIVSFQSEMMKNLEPVQMGRSLVDGLAASVRNRLREAGVPEEEISQNIREQTDLSRQYNPTEVAVRLIDEHLLKRALATIPRKFAEDPETEAAVREIVADAYEQLGRYSFASPEYERALELRRELFGNEHESTLESVADLGMLRLSQGRDEEARELLTEAVDGRRLVLGIEHPETIASIQNLGMFYEKLGEFDQAEDQWQKGLDLSLKVNGEKHPITILLLGNLGVLYTKLGRVDEAEPLIKRDYELTRRMWGDEDPFTLKSKRNLAQIALMRGDIDEAARLIAEAAASYRTVLGDRHPDTLSTLTSLGTLRLQQGRTADGADLLRVAYEGRYEVLGADHPDTYQSLQQVAQGYLIAQDAESALPFVEQSVQESAKRMGESNPQTVLWLDTLGLLLRDTGRYADSEVVLKQVRAICESTQELTKLPVCVATPERFVRLYTLWHEAEPEAGHDVLKRQWEKVQNPPDLNAN